MDDGMKFQGLSFSFNFVSQINQWLLIKILK